MPPITEAKRAYDRARRARLRVDRRPTSCKGCGAPITQPRTSVRLYCDDRCKYKAWYWRTPGHGYQPAEVFEPLPMPYVGDAVFEQARAAANIHGDYSVDWGQHDIIGTAVLAILEGQDPKRAVNAFRRTERRIERSKMYGIADVAVVDGQVVVAWEHDRE